MAKTKISEFSATANSNTDINSINIAEGCAPSNINDAIRELMAELKDFQAGTKGDSFNGPVGTSTAAAGAFTTLSSTGNTTLGDASGDTVTINGTTTFVNVNPTLSAGTANGVLYLNGSKVATSGSALTFDGAGVFSVVDSSSPRVSVNGSSTASGYLIFKNTTSNTNVAYVGYDFANSAMPFAVSGSEQMRLTSTGLGIGTSSPGYKLDARLSGTSSGAVIQVGNTGSGGFGGLGVSDGGAYPVQMWGSALSFLTGSSVYGSATEKMRLDSSGNLGLGVTPSNAYSGLRSFEIGANGVLYSETPTGIYNSMSVGLNFYYDSAGTAKYKNSSLQASRYNQYQGQHQWYTAASGTAGNTITFTQAMTLDASGNLVVGTTSANGRLTIDSGSAALMGSFNSTNANGGYIILSTSGTVYGDIGTAFQAVGGSASDFAINARGARNLVLGTNNTERARIDSSGNLGIGTTSPSATVHANASGGGSVRASRSSVSGEYIQLDHDGTNGTLRVSGANNLIFNTNSAERARIDSSGNLLVGKTSTSDGVAGFAYQPARDGAGHPRLTISDDGSTNSYAPLLVYSVGASAARFYVGAGGTVYATSTTITAISDQRLKENIQDLDVGLEKIMALKPRKFDWKAGKGKDKKGDRGWIAQEFEQVFPDMIDTWADPAPEGEEPYKAVNADLIPVLVKAIQEQQAIIEQLKARLDAANL